VHNVDIKCCLTLSIYVVTLYYLLVKFPKMQYVGLTPVLTRYIHQKVLKEVKLSLCLIKHFIVKAYDSMCKKSDTSQTVIYHMK
jgi:hypothetical protein